MPITTKKTARLSFLTEGGKSFTIAFDNPKEGLTKEEAEAVMTTIIEKDVILSSSGPLISVRDIKVVNTSTDDLFDPPPA